MVAATQIAEKSAGEGTKGARLHDRAYLELADLDAAEYNRDFREEWTGGLLIRRNIADGGSGDNAGARAGLCQALRHEPCLP